MAADNRLNLAFGETLRRARIRAKITQEKLALDSGLDRTFISGLERGVRQPTLRTLFLLSRTLNVAPHVLVKRTQVLLLQIPPSAQKTHSG